MTQSTETPLGGGPQPTQHAMLILWGLFAQELGLLDQLAAVPIAEKTVQHSSAAKLATLFMGLLSGIEFLTDLTRRPAPLYHDPAVARAWGLAALPEASGVSRTLAAASARSLTALQTVLEALTVPFLAQALADLQSRNAPLILDADLTGQPVSDTSTTYPGAAFGYMDGTLHLGYQLAVVCLETALYGRQWLVGQQHPGDTVAAPCLLGLVQAVERRLGCPPRRRPALLAVRIALAEACASVWDQQTTRHRRIAQQGLAREERLLGQIEQAHQQLQALHQHPPSSRQGGPRSTRTALLQQIAGWERQLGRMRQQWATAVQRAERAAAAAAAARTPIAAWQTRQQLLAAENARQPTAPRCILRLDSGFSSGPNLTTLLELGYDSETKAGNAAVVRALRRQVTAATPWTRVGRNAEMVGWVNYQMRTCPYPLTVGLERFRTPQGDKYAVLVRYQADPSAACPDLAAWFHQYNARGGIEAGIKQAKTVFPVQHPFSRTAVGMSIQIALTLFAANFVGWSQEWLRTRMQGRQNEGPAGLGGVKQWTTVLANSRAQVEQVGDQVVVSFDKMSSCRDLVIHMRAAGPVQLALPW